MTIRIYSICIFLLFAASNFAQLTIKVTEIPANTPAMDDIHIAGNFQNWDPSNSNHILTNNGDGTFQITISPEVGQVEFKFARGSWEKVESTANGGFVPNRTLNYNGSAQTVEMQIMGWEDLNGGTGGGNSTAAENVFILDENYDIPQLNRERRVWVYLPPDYDDSNKHYPVLYMHDAQNIFDASASFSGEWEVDESLNELFENGDFGCIVVGIDNGGVHRIDEYSPWNNPQYGGGEGGAYMDFIVNTLKPDIDDNYRTLPGREYTGLMGSSLGGLISHYGIVEHQSVFSKVGIFSPAYWFVDQIYWHTESVAKEYPVKIYMIGGQNEGSGMAQKINDMYWTLMNEGYEQAEIFKEIHEDGAHSEWYWRREFPAAYQWLFGDLYLTPIQEVDSVEIDVFPNPADSLLKIEGLNVVNSPYFEMYSINGKLLDRANLDSDQIDISNFGNGLYLLKIFAESNVIFYDKFVVQH